LNIGLIIKLFYSKYEILAHICRISIQIINIKLNEMKLEEIKYDSTERFNVDQIQRNNPN